MRVVSLICVVALVAGCGKPSDTDDTDVLDTDPVDTEVDTDPVDADADGSLVADDCDDNDAARFPGNVEWCDGVDGDCDGNEATGLVTFRPPTGAPADLTSTFTSATIVAYTFEDPGTLAFCGGTWLVALSLNDAVDVVGFGGPTLDGDGSSAIRVEAGQTSNLTDLNVTASNRSFPMARAVAPGAAIYVASGATARAEGLALTDSAVGLSFLAGSTVELVDVDGTDNNRVLDGYGDTAGATLVVQGGTFTGSDDSAASLYAVTASFEDTAFVNNASWNVGGAIAYEGEALTLTDVSFTGSTSYGDGGALRVLGNAVVTNSSFTDSVAGGGRGGAIAAQDGTLTVTGSTFEDSFAYGNGGALAVDFTATTVTDSDFLSNEAGDPNCDCNGALGGAVFVGYGSALTLTGGSFLRNSATGEGGGIYGECGSSGVITNVTFGDLTDENAPDDGVWYFSSYDLDGVTTDLWTGVCDA